MFEELRQIISSKFQIDAEDITPRASLTELELDSLDTVELSLVIEKELLAQVSDVELAEAENLAEIVRLVESRTVRV